MRTFTCDCGGDLYFENMWCFRCRREVAYLPDRQIMSPLETLADGTWLAVSTGERYRKCQNAIDYGVCNWLVSRDDDRDLCLSCQLNRVIPDLTDPGNVTLWGEIERAKRRLVYGLHRLALPVVAKYDDPERGLAFAIMADTPEHRVITGHRRGLITINLEEADTVTREWTRLALSERNRTVLGHLRHEVGHYYWDLLVEGNTLFHNGFRTLFGDERQDYHAALDDHYTSAIARQAPEFISAYAAVHPWEDWAEIWAQYLLMAETIETAVSRNLLPGTTAFPAPGQDDSFAALSSHWSALTVTLNEISRSLGLPDAFPLALTPEVKDKLELVHEVVGSAANPARR